MGKMTTKKTPTVREYSISYPIHGHVHVVVKASSESEAVEHGRDVAGTGDSDIEWELGFPCHTGWPEFDITNVEGEEK